MAPLSASAKRRWGTLHQPSPYTSHLPQSNLSCHSRCKPTFHCDAGSPLHQFLRAHYWPTTVATSDTSNRRPSCFGGPPLSVATLQYLCPRYVSLQRPTLHISYCLFCTLTPLHRIAPPPHSYCSSSARLIPVLHSAPPHYALCLSRMPSAVISVHRSPGASCRLLHREQFLRECSTTPAEAATALSPRGSSCYGAQPLSTATFQHLCPWYVSLQRLMLYLYYFLFCTRSQTHRVANSALPLHSHLSSSACIMPELHSSPPHYALCLSGMPSALLQIHRPHGASCRLL
jgi:hypothetical protein